AKAAIAAGNPDISELLGARDRQVPQANRVDQLEDRRVGPDAEGEREDGHEREARTSPKQAQGVANVAPDVVDPFRVTRVAAGVLLLFDAAQCDHGGPPCFVRRGATSDKLLDLPIDVEPQLLIELR